MKWNEIPEVKNKIADVHTHTQYVCKTVWLLNIWIWKRNKKNFFFFWIEMSEWWWSMWMWMNQHKKKIITGNIFFSFSFLTIMNFFFFFTPLLFNNDLIKLHKKRDNRKKISNAQRWISKEMKWSPNTDRQTYTHTHIPQSKKIKKKSNESWI